jgi:cycloeucalenol cycloisomerase
MTVRFMSENPGKRIVERFFLFYAPVWVSAAAAAALTGAAARWGDLELMIFGTALWLPVLLVPIFWRAPQDRKKPFWKLFGFKIHAWLFFLALSGNYVTFYFYEVLHMHYGFRTSLNVNNVPLFITFLTVAYFSTYYVLLNTGYRFLRSVLPARSPSWARSLMVVPVSLAVALLETATHANPFMRSVFCYDDLPFMLSFGTVMYGAWFIIAVPFWFPIDENPGDDTPWGYVLLSFLAAFTLILACSELFKQVIAPYFTAVVDGAPGLRDYAGSCLAPPPLDSAGH